MTGSFSEAALALDPLLMITIVLLGLAVGVLAGLFGIGGGFLTTPLLNLLFGIPYTQAVASGLCALIGTTSGGVSRHQRLGNIDWRTLTVVSGGAVGGAILGARTHRWLHQSASSRYGEPAFDLVMNLLYCIVLLIVIYLFLRFPVSRLRQSQSSAPAPWSIGRSVRLVFLGEIAGAMGGLLGVGGGIIILPFLAGSIGLGLRRAVATNLGIVLIVYIAGTAKYAWHGAVSLPIALGLLVGSIVGVQFGIWLHGRLDVRVIRQAFVGVVALLIASLLIRSGWILQAG